MQHKTSPLLHLNRYFLGIIKKRIGDERDYPTSRESILYNSSLSLSRQQKNVWAKGEEKRRFSGTTSRKVCTRYNKRTWSHRPRIIVGSSMWDIAALLTAIDTFPICWQTTQSLSTSLRFDACPFEHRDRGRKERKKEMEGR